MLSLLGASVLPFTGANIRNSTIIINNRNGGGGGGGGGGYLDLKEQKSCHKTEGIYVANVRCTQIRNFYVMSSGWTEGSRLLHIPSRK